MAERELDGLRAYAGELTAQFEALRRNVGELQRELAALTATAKSPDGYVTATVGARGQLVRLQLDPRIYRRPDSQQLAASITDTVQKAAAEALERVKEVSQRYAPGADLPATMQGDLLKRLERFGFVEDRIGGGNA